MGFQWDAENDAANRAKQLVGFRQAAEFFRGFRLTVEDTQRDYGERRLIALGTYDNAALPVVYKLRGVNIRILSAWKASRHDRETYAKARDARPV